MTKTIIEGLVKAKELGSPDKVACKAVSLSYETFRVWKKRGRKERDHIDSGGKRHPAEGPYYRLFLQLEEAEARGINRNLQRIEDAADDDWRAARWWLSRRPEFSEKPVSPIKQMMASMLLAISDSDNEITPEKFLEIVGRLPTESGEDVDAIADMMRTAFSLVRGKLAMQRAKEEVIDKQELDQSVSLMQAALREGLASGHFDRDLEDFKAGTLTAEDVVERAEARIKKTIEGPYTGKSDAPW